MADPSDTINGVTVVPKASQEYLSEKQAVDYAAYRTKLIEWALNIGKDPQKGKGYSPNTVRPRAIRIDQFFRYVWSEQTDGYTLQITHDHADEWMTQLAFGDNSQDANANCQKAAKMYFKWRSHAADGETWEPEMTFSNTASTTAKRDRLTRDERPKLREAALDFGSVPHYDSVDPEDRDEWKRYLARQFNISMDEVTLEHWERANSWKIPSLVFVSLDLGLRPIEVKRMDEDWVDIDNRQIIVPPEGNRKEEHEWECAITDRTTTVLDHWLDQRSHLSFYEDRDALWLTEKGNRYTSSSLRKLMIRLCEEANINLANREKGWYLIRRGTATDMVEVGGLSHAQVQMRHSDPTSTMRYDQTPTDTRRNDLDRLG